jgi:hypothetical protein
MSLKNCPNTWWRFGAICDTHAKLVLSSFQAVLRFLFTYDGNDENNTLYINLHPIYHQVNLN